MCNKQNYVSEILNRDKKNEKFDISKIVDCLYRSADSIGGFSNEIQRFSDDVQKNVFLEYKGLGSYGISKILANKVKCKLEENNILKPKISEILDFCELILGEQGFFRTKEHFVSYRFGRCLVNQQRIDENQFMWNGLPQNPGNPIRRLFIKSGQYNRQNGIFVVEELNELFKDRKRLLTVMKECEALYDASIEGAVKAFLKKNAKHPIRLVKIAGPSSSAKTTTTNRFVEKLIEYDSSFKGMIHSFEGDNYFKTLSDIGKDDWGDINYECPDSMLFDRLVKDIEDLINGKTIYPPYHNFHTGITEEPGQALNIPENGIFVLDNLFCVYDKLTPNVPDECQFTIYIETLDHQLDLNRNVIKFCDRRLLRRMIRDVRTRNHGIEATLQHWHYVRNGELRYIIPFAGLADYWVNGSNPCELPIIVNEIRKRGGIPGPDIFLKKKPRHLDAYLRGKRVEELFNSFEPIDDDIKIPEHSFLREFVGEEA